MHPENDWRDRSRPRLIDAAAAAFMLLIAVSSARAQQPGPSEQLPAGFAEKTATVDGVKLAYKIGGTGPVVVLIHGYTQTSHMWLPLLSKLQASRTVIAP